jgi:RNA polymerase sigma factor (sigma-70 family)
MTDEPGYLNIHQEYIDRCRKGDRKAQFEIYSLYFKSMYNTSLRIVKDPQEAEDIMQESFLSAFIKINTYSGKVSFGSWLKKIVVNSSLDALKKKRLFTEELDEELAEQVAQEAENDTDYKDIRIEDIMEAVNELPDGYRVVLSLKLFEGYDHDEIAEILEISNSSSRSQFTRAKQKLLSILKKKKNDYGKS